MSLSPKEPEGVSARDNWLVAAGLFIFDRHQLLCFLAGLAILLVPYFVYMLPMTDDFMDHPLRTVVILLMGPVGGALLWKLDKALKNLFTGHSHSYATREKGRTALPLYPGRGEQSPKPAIRNYSAALGAGLTGLALQYTAQKKALKAAVDMPHKEFLEEFDRFEAAMKSGRTANAYSHLFAIVSPHAYKKAKYVIHELYSPILGDRVMLSEIKFLFRSPAPDELLELSVDYLMAGDSAGCVRSLMRLGKAGTVSLTHRILAGMILDRVIEHSRKVKRMWADFRDDVWEAVVAAILEDNTVVSTAGGLKVYTARSLFSDIVIRCEESATKGLLEQRIVMAWDILENGGIPDSLGVPIPMTLVEHKGVWHYLTGCFATSRAAPRDER